MKIARIVIGTWCMLMVGVLCAPAGAAVWGGDYFDYSSLTDAAASADVSPGAFPADSLQQSIGVMRELIKEQPHNIQLYLILAENLRGVGAYDEALACVDNVLAADPDHIDGLRLKATLHAARGEKDKCLAAYEHVVRVDYLNYYNHFLLARYYLTQEMFGAAKKEFEQTIAINPFFPDAYFYLGQILYFRGKYDEALQALLKVVELNDRNYAAYNNIGVIYQLQNRQVEAVSCFKKALKVNSTYEYASINMARHVLKNGDLAGARQLLEQALEQNPSRERTRYLLGIIYEYQNDAPKAVEQFQYLVAHDSTNVSYRSILARLAVRAKQRAVAEEQYRYLVDHDLAGDTILVEYAALLIKLKRHDEALQLCQQIVARNASYKKVYFMMTKLYLMTGQVMKAFRAFTQSGAYVYSTVMITVLVIVFVVVVGFAFNIFFRTDE